ncbi:MAG: RNA polymerase subunit sigma-24 [Gemmatimonadota bacterium]
MAPAPRRRERGAAPLSASRRILHVLNGDATAELLARSGLSGDRLPFREALVSGPTPDLGRARWRACRAAHLASEAGTDRADVEAELERTDRALDQAREYEEVVLWFEHDLFCQVNLIHLLARLGLDAPEGSNLRLVCIAEHPGVPDFRGLGQLSAAQLAALFEQRAPVTEGQIALATEAWGAYRSPDPAAIENLLAGDTADLPFLREALELHLARFPSTRNGLGLVENVALGRMLQGVEDFATLFREFEDAEPGYGFGDLQFLAALERLARGREPLLVAGGEGPTVRQAEVTPGLRFRLTDAGRRVAESERDHVEMNGIDLWLGGAHLRDDRLWRWDERAEELVAVGTAVADA